MRDPKPAGDRRREGRGHRAADARAQPRQRAPQGHRDPGPRLRREARPPARGHGRALRRQGALEGVVVRARADRPSSTSAGPARCGRPASTPSIIGGGGDRGGPRAAAVPAARRDGPGDDRHRRGLALRAHRPALGQGRDHLGRCADQRRAQGDPPPRRRLAAGHPRRDGRGHRRRRRGGAAARRARAGRRSRSTGDYRIGVEIVRAALTEPVHLIASNAGLRRRRRRQAGHRAWASTTASTPSRAASATWSRSASSTRCGSCARRCRTAPRWPG